MANSSAVQHSPSLSKHTVLASFSTAAVSLGRALGSPLCHCQLSTSAGWTAWLSDGGILTTQCLSGPTGRKTEGITNDDGDCGWNDIHDFDIPITLPSDGAHQRNHTYNVRAGASSTSQATQPKDVEGTQCCNFFLRSRLLAALVRTPVSIGLGGTSKSAYAAHLMPPTGRP